MIHSDNDFLRRWAALLGGLLLTACAERQPAGPVLENVHIREPAPGQTVAAAFGTFRNDTDRAFTLNHVKSPAAGHAEVHRTLYEAGKMKMRPARHLVIAPRSTLGLEPGGYHVMLHDIRGDYAVGTTIPIEFQFEDGYILEVEAQIRPIH